MDGENKDKNDRYNNKLDELKEKTRLLGCEMTEEQILFVLATLEKEWVMDSYLRNRGLEFANERTRQSVAEDFEKLIFDPENKDTPFDELFNALVTDENGDFISELFSSDCMKKNFVTVYGDKASLKNISGLKILPPCGNLDMSDNPFEKGSWNMTKQLKIYRENPEIAKYLAAEAKHKLM